MKKHSDPLTRPNQQLGLSQSYVFKIRIFWIIHFRSQFFQFQFQFCVFSNFQTFSDFQTLHNSFFLKKIVFGVILRNFIHVSNYSPLYALGKYILQQLQQQIKRPLRMQVSNQTSLSGLCPALTLQEKRQMSQYSSFKLTLQSQKMLHLHSS